jgi:hypothetical protein
MTNRETVTTNFILSRRLEYVHLDSKAIGYQLTRSLLFAKMPHALAAARITVEIGR